MNPSVKPRIGKLALVPLFPKEPETQRKELEKKVDQEKRKREADLAESDPSKRSRKWSHQSSKSQLKRGYAQFFPRPSGQRVQQSNRNAGGYRARKPYRGHKLYKGQRREKLVLPKSNHSITIKSNRKTPYIQWIAEGVKTAEGRVCSSAFARMKVGETVCFYNYTSYVLCKIVGMHKYPSFEDMVDTEGPVNLIPSVKSLPEERQRDAAVAIYKGFPGSQRVQRMGAVAIVVKPIESKL